MLQPQAVTPAVTTGRRVAAASVWLISWSLGAAALAMAAFGGGDPQALRVEVHSEFFVPDLIIGVVYGLLAAAVIAGSRHAVGWVFAVIAVGFSLTAFAIQYAVLGTEHTLPAYSFVVHLVTWAWSAGAFLVVLVLPWILDRTPTRLARRAAAFGLVVTVLACLTRALRHLEGAPANPLSPSPRVSEVAHLVDGWAIPFYFLLGLLGAGHLVRRFNRAGPDERRGLAWVTTSILLVCVAYLAFETGLSMGGRLLVFAAAALFAGQVMLPAAVFVLILRQPAGGLDVAVSRTTMWGLLTALVAGAYVALVWAAGGLFPEDSAVSAAVAAAVLALAISPLQRWLQRRVDRLVYGSGADPEELLRRLAADVAHGDLEKGAGLEGLVESLRRSMRLRYVAVRSAPGRPHVGAVAGAPVDSPIRIPLAGTGAQVGRMDVGARPGERLDPRTVRLLEQISGLVAVSLELAQVNHELEAARSRMLEIRHEERRLLRRELHDGLGPALAGSSLALAAIANNSPEMSSRDTQLLVQLRAELDRRAEDVRDMARAMLPPSLDDGRLYDALVVLAQRFTDDRFQVELDVEGADDLDSTRQVAIYHVAAEAVFNAHRHSGAARCRVRLSRTDDGGRRLSVHDDGSGPPAEATDGIGLASMRERALELGGTFDLVHDAEGTTLTVVLP